MIVYNATQYCACSSYAGISVFGKHAMSTGKVKIIKNGIDLSAFQDRAPVIQEKLRKDCNADNNTCLIGFVGRFSPEKNPSFMLDMAAEAKKMSLNYRFILVGAGDLQEELMRKRQYLGLDDIVFFLGTREDVPLLMQCFDMVVIPSFSEGFSIVAAEAQAAGRPVLAAPCIPKEANMGLNLLHFMRLEAGAISWVEQIGIILKTFIRPDTKTCMDALRAQGFDVQDNVKTLLELYGFCDTK